jgi:segregation and condensation protein A
MSEEPGGGKREETEKQAQKREAAESASPYSISVGQVYDGPLDLLLDLIRKQDIDIYDIPIGRITAQFLAYVEGLKQTEVDAAADFIYVASLLIHIKSRMLLPRTSAEGDNGEQEDPRRELVERLLEHERFKNAAQMLLQKQQIEAATWSNPAMRQFRAEEGEQEIAADTVDLVRVFREILDRARQRPVLDVNEEAVTVGQMLDYVKRRLMMEERPVSLSSLLRNTRSERALICMFLALLELVRLQAILLRQDSNFGEVYIKKHPSFESVLNQGLMQAKDDWR